MLHRNDMIRCSCANKLYPAQHTLQHTLFNKFQIWKCFLNASAGHSKRCSGPQHAAREPVVGPHWPNQTTLMQSSFYTLRGLLCIIH